MNLSYNELYNKLINNFEKYNLYFGIILLAKLAKLQNIGLDKFKTDIYFLKGVIQTTLELPDAYLLDIEDGKYAYSDLTLQKYNLEDLLWLMEGL